MKKTFLGFCILLSSYALFAQEPGRIINFRSFDSDTIPTEATRRPLLNSVKFNLSLVPRGLALINYERQLSGSFSLEAGIGVVIGPDLPFQFAYGFQGGFDAIDPFDAFTTSPEPALAYEIGFKLFPSGDGFLEEIYVNPVFSYRTYRFPTNNSNGVEMSETIGYNFTDYSLRFGAQSEMWLLDVYSEWYVGVGYRVGQMQISEFNHATRSYSIVTEDLRLPQFTLGVKIALPF